MTFLKSAMLNGLLLALLACGGGADSGDAAKDAGDKSGDETDDGSDTPKGGPTSGTKDAGGKAASSPKDTSAPTTGTAKDAGATSKPEARDSGSVASASKDAGAAPSSASGTDAGKDNGDGLMIPDLFPSDSDAGSSTKPAASGTRDPTGPCEDLELVCFDIFDMFIINPDDCLTCNHGMGCQGCAIPFAY